jgi:hypothetical protein
MVFSLLARARNYREIEKKTAYDDFLTVGNCIFYHETQETTYTNLEIKPKIMEKFHKKR